MWECGSDIPKLLSTEAKYKQNEILKTLQKCYFIHHITPPTLSSLNVSAAARDSPRSELTFGTFKLCRHVKVVQRRADELQRLVESVGVS